MRELAAEFERLHPGIASGSSRSPGARRTRSCSTAYVGDAMPDVFQLGNTWIPEFVALDALAPLDERVAGSRRARARRLLRRHHRHQRGRRPPLRRALVRRHAAPVLSQRHPGARPAIREPPRSWEAWRRRDGGDRAAAPARRRDAIILPINEWAPLVVLALQQGAGAAVGRRDLRRLPARRRSARRSTSTSRCSSDGFASADGRAPQIANLYQEFAAGRFAMYISGPWNLGEFARRLPADLQDDWATAPMPSPDGRYPGVSLAGGASLAIYRDVRAPGRRLAAGRVPQPDAAAGPLLRAHRRPAGADRRLAGPGARRRPRARAFFEQLQRIRATPKIPEWERIATAITPPGRAAGARRDARPMPRSPALDAEVDRSSRSAAGCSARERGGVPAALRSAAAS